MTISTLAEGRYIDVNKAWQEAFGYSREEVIGKTATEIHSWANLDDRKRIIDRLEKDGFVSDFEATLHGKSGQQIYCVISVARFDTDGETFLLFSAHDLTKRKQLEAELRLSETMQNAAADQAKLAYWRWSFAEQKLTDWSANYQNINAYGDNIPESYDDMLKPVHPDDKDRVIATYEKADLGPDNFDVEYRVFDLDGNLRWLKEHGEVEYDEAGKAIAHIGIIQDITDL
ncbi:MAG: PAS domain S-box protein [Rhodospirillales bacterium]|nr:PAS domain S-box protein [Rhodospirillales bacterium]